MKTLRSLTWHDAGKWLVAAILLCGAAAVRGQDALEIIGGDAKQIKVERQVITYVDATLVSKLPFTLKAPAGGFEYEWTLPKSIVGTTKRNVLEVTEAIKGEATISVTWLVLTVENGAIKQTERSAVRTFYVGEVKPVPPDPKPDPKPVPVGGLRVIFVAKNKSDLTREQLNAWNSSAIAAYLNEKCVKDGTQPAWRKWDSNVVLTEAVPVSMKQLWSDAKADAVAAVPCVIVAVGQQATIYPLTTEAEVMTKLKQHAEGR